MPENFLPYISVIWIKYYNICKNKKDTKIIMCNVVSFWECIAQYLQ